MPGKLFTDSKKMKILSFWKILKSAFMGTESDYTTGSLSRSIFLLAVPMVLEMAMESIFVVVDIFFVARLGSDAISAVGLTEAIITLVYAVSIGLSMAATAMVARRVGEKKMDAACNTGVHIIAFGILLTLPISVVGIFWSDDILVLMGASKSVVETGSSYTAIMLGCNISIMLLFINNAVFRGAGDASLAMRSLWIANGLNLILDPCLIFGLGPFPELGLPGAAIATSIGRGCGVLYQFYILFNGSSRMHILSRHIQFHWSVFKRLMRVSSGAVLQYILATGSWVIMARLIAQFGSEAVAGYTIAIRVVIFTIMPAWGMANASATLVGQNLGAGKPDRAEKAVWHTAGLNLIFLMVVSVFFIFFPRPIIGFFTSDSTVIDFGVSCLRYLAYGYGFFAYGLVVAQSFNGAGDTFTPSAINLFCYWVLQLPLAWMLSTQTSLGAEGVFMAIMVTESTLAIVSIAVFRRGKWKGRVV